MKKITKLFSMILVFAMLLVSSLPLSSVSAEEITEPVEKGSIQINKAVVGQTYSIYKILTLETYDKDNNNYIYRVEPAWSDFVKDANYGGKYLTVVDAQNGKDYVIWKKGVTKEDVAKLAADAMEYAKEHSDTIKKTGESIKANSTTVKFEGLDLGYYLVESSLGAICGLTTTDKDAEVNEKNTIEPGLEKIVIEDSTGLPGEKNDAQIGDVVTFKTTITTGARFYKYVLHDTMSQGLTLKEIVSITVNGTEVAAEGKYTINNPGLNGDTFTIVFEDKYIETLPKGTKIVVEYTATLNENAFIYEVNPEGNINTAKLTYKDENDTDKEPKTDTTTTYAYSFELIKRDGDTEETLLGAEFELYEKDKTTLVPVTFVETKDGVNYYRVAVEGATGVKIQAGKAIIRGLDNDTYYLKETTAPTGYNPLTDEVAVNVSKYVTGEEKYTMATTTVDNYSGTKLPETGGMGTVLFMTIGSLLVIAFGVLLVTKLRMSKISA